MRLTGDRCSCWGVNIVYMPTPLDAEHRFRRHEPVLEPVDIFQILCVVALPMALPCVVHSAPCCVYVCCVFSCFRVLVAVRRPVLSCYRVFAAARRPVFSCFCRRRGRPCFRVFVFSCFGPRAQGRVRVSSCFGPRASLVFPCFSASATRSKHSMGSLVPGGTSRRRWRWKRSNRTHLR